MWKTLACLAGILSSLGLVLAADKTKEPTSPPPLAIDRTLLDQALFETPLEAIRGAYRVDPTEEQKAHYESRQKAIAKAGGELPPLEPELFQWLSAEKIGLRAAPGTLTFLDEPVGEVIIRAGAPEKAGTISVSLYNRGDDGDLSAMKLSEGLEHWKARISTALGSQPTQRNQQGTVNLTGWMWRYHGGAWLLESSSSKGSDGARAEFLRIRIASLNGGSDGKVARRSGLSSRLVKKENGDAFLEGIPMVDQGTKGYCAVATTERVVRYYGLDVDQHEMAGIANTGKWGTSMVDMEAALKSATGKLNVKTIKHFELDFRQFQQDVRSYNQAAKKAGESEFVYERKEAIVDPIHFWAKLDPEIFLKLKTDQSGFPRFKQKIREFIDQGIPVCWALQLGMFKETGIPQTRGGHMRLIIGYNEKTDELLYSDSWGNGHEFKRMPAGQAWCMTMAIYTMVPTR